MYFVHYTIAPGNGRPSAHLVAGPYSLDEVLLAFANLKSYNAHLDAYISLSATQETSNAPNQ